jgi:hypothetical protein
VLGEHWTPALGVKEKFQLPLEGVISSPTIATSLSSSRSEKTCANDPFSAVEEESQPFAVKSICA